MKSSTLGIRIVVLALGAVTCGTMPAGGHEPGPTIEERLDALERRNAELERELRALQSRNENIVSPVTSRAGETMAGDGALPGMSYSADRLDARIELALDERWPAGLHPNGGGFFLKSPNDEIELKLLGYVQAQGTLTDGTGDASFENGDFRIRRARVDLMVEMFDQYELFVEFEGATTGGTSLRIARINAEILDETLQLRAGKFITPFSTANNRSSRNLDTIERYIALNSMFSLPALDTQIGAMLWGTLPAGRARPPTGEAEAFRPNFTYQLGLWNGSNSGGSETVNGIGGNARNANGGKEIQLKLLYEPAPALHFGLGFDYDQAATKDLVLSSLSGIPYIRVNVPGTRYGISADFLWEPGRFSLRGEGLFFEFDEAETRLYGGFLQAAYFITGDETGGVQTLLRGEHAALEGKALARIDGHSITALTAGVNWFLNGNVRVQINYIGEYFDSSGNAGIGSESFRSTLLTQLQFKF